MALRSSLSDIRRNASPLAAPADPVPPDTTSLEEPVEGSPLDNLKPEPEVVDEPTPRQAAPVVRRSVAQVVEQDVSDVEAKLRSTLASIEDEASRVKQQIAAAIAKFEPKLEQLRTKHSDVLSQLQDHLFKKL